jgi:cobalamin biosynthesis Mg chelatase CobN
MSGMRQASGPLAGRLILALSVLALLAFSCFPVLAQADSSGIQYSDAPPTVTGSHKIPTQSEPSAHSSKANGGAKANGSGGSGSSGKGSSAGGSSSKSGGAPATANGGGTGQQGSPGKGSANGSGNLSGTTQSGKPASSQDSGSSSPLVPILIAIAVLAAISIGVVAMQRRRRGSAPSVSPKAG